MTDDSDSGIAIIGMAGRFPGAKNLEEFWKNLRDGVEAVHRFTDEELLAAGESPERLRDPNYVKALPRVDGVDRYDAAFFGHSPRDAAIMDPQHRFFLETAWETLEHAGYVGEAFDGPIGVFATGGFNAYMMHHLVTNPELMESVGEWLIRHLQNDPNFLATRVSYEMNLKGPSMTIQTACSSALVAIHMAAQSLLNGECDMALAGGSTLVIPQDRGYLYKEGEILAPDGHCRPFDASSKGTLFGSGVGCVLLKRLEDAKADRDTIYAVIRGSAINNDGSSKVGFLAPSIEGQARVVAEALALAGVPAESIACVEAHGTATLIGDPIEVAALVQAYRATTPKKQFCALGSVKSNIGHLGEAAGAAGLLKVVLSLVNEKLAPSLNYERPNPNIDFANSPFFVNATLRDWPATGAPRRAGVTALGAGGTNVHVILEEAPRGRPEPSPSRAQKLLVLSARTPTALDAATANLAAHLRAHPEHDLADVAFTLQVGRKVFSHRRAIVAATRDEAIATLESGDPKRLPTVVHKQGKPSLVFMIPGGGAQYARMGRDLYDAEPVYRGALDECLNHISRELASKLRALLFAPPAEAEAATKALERPSLALPALFATSYALARLLMDWGLAPAALIGHSAGEYVAACLAGCITPREGMALVATRGRLFETLPEGGMLSVALSEADARGYMGTDLAFAALNAPTLSVVSGPVAAIAAMQERLRAKEIDCTRIHIDVAAHSPMLDPILDEFEAFCRTIAWKAPKIPLVSNLTGAWITEAEVKDPTYWVRHLRSTVRFADGMKTLLDDPNRVLVEVGPGRTLSSLGRQQPKKVLASVSTLRHPKEEASDVAFLLGTLGKLWSAGVAPDWNAFYGDEERRRIPLPTYPFERQRFWIERGQAAPTAAPREAVLRKRPDVGDWFYLPSWKRSVPPLPRAGAASFLLFLDAAGLGKKLAARLAGHAVTTVSPGASFARVGENAYTINPAERADYDALVAELEAQKRLPQTIVHLWSVTPSKPPWARLGGLANPSSAALATLAKSQELHFYGLLFLAQALTGHTEPFDLVVVSNELHQVAGESELAPEKATLLGPCRVIPREFPNVTARSVDVVLPPAKSWQEARLLDELTAEVTAASSDPVIAFRGADRWVQSIDPVRLEKPAQPAHVRPGGVYLITGGLGGIGLAIADHLARSAPNVKLVLVGRAALPTKATWSDWLAMYDAENATSRKILAVQALERLGAEVMTASADVTERGQMEKVVEAAKKQFGAIHGVIHSAGQLNDVLIELRPSVLESDVLDTKVKGALVLDAILHGDDLDFFVLFSSVSAVLGLPGQADYTAANAFLDAFALKRSASGRTRTVSIDWSAWQEVGMAASLAARNPSPTLPVTTKKASHPLWDFLAESEGETVFRSEMRRDKHWVLGEHVVLGGEALIPGTGFLELARAALAHSPDTRPIELRDVVFLAPFIVRSGETRELRAKLARGGDFVIYSESEAAPHVVGKVRYIDAPSRDTDAPAREASLAAIAARCTAREVVYQGFTDQTFMDFGKRWANVRKIAYGQGEALVRLELPEELEGDLRDYRLHPGLLDMATGGAQALVPGFDPANHFYVPFSYGRLVVRGGLPRTILSHVRYREGGANGSAVFDVTIYDERGAEVVAITDFVMRRVSDVAIMKSGPTSRVPEPSLGGSWSTVLRDNVLKEGILPAEGVDAFARILAHRGSAQMLVSSVDLPAWQKKTADEAAPRAPAQAEGGVTRPELSTPFKAPRNDVERKLAAFWRELLGVEHVGIHDDFFELGGQSLIAVRLFNKLRKEYGVDLPLSTLFEAPTIAQCSEIVHGELGLAFHDETASQPTLDMPSTKVDKKPARSRWSSLVPMQPKGGRIPFYCVAGMGGNLANLRKLATLVGGDQPMYGLQPPGLDGKEKRLYRVEQLAAHYIKEVLAFQPVGPFCLGGYSGGGVAAFEMACQLVAAGHEVRFLGFLDSFSPSLPQKPYLKRAKIHAERVAEGGPGYLVDLARRRLWYESAQMNRVVARVMGKVFPEKYRYDNIGDSWMTAEQVYVPPKYAGAATLFRAAEETALSLWTAYDVDAEHGWGRYVLGGVDVEICPGNHTSMCEEPHVHVLAAKLRARLDAANGVQAGPASQRPARETIRREVAAPGP